MSSIDLRGDRRRTFATVAAEYHAAGWCDALAMPHGQKFPPPDGFTGRTGRHVTDDDRARWSQEYADAFNVSIRLPVDVIGLDVDDYDDHGGGATFAALLAEHGPLPTTARSTSRTDGVSGIRLFRVPAGTSWPGTAGRGIDVVQNTHRYVMTAPSVHPEGGRYAWLDDDGREVAVPSLDDLPALPAAWLTALTTRTTRSTYAPAPGRADVAAPVWLATRRGGEPCRHVTTTLERHLRAMTGSGRYDAMAKATHSLVGLAAADCPGTATALDTYESAYRAAVANVPNRDHTEFARAVGDSVTKLAHSVQTYGCSVTPRTRQTPPAVPGGPQESPDPSQAPGVAPAAPDPSEAPTASPARRAAEVAEELWTARPSLAHVRDLAHAHRTAPLAMLGAVLCHVVAMAGPDVVTPPMVGGCGNLNTFVALVGTSGTGKSAALDVAAAAVLFDRTEVVTHGSPVSGEGLAKMYRRGLKPGDGDAGEGWKTHRALVTVDEVETLTALGGRQGATLMSLLRTAWSGARISLEYSDESKSVTLPARAYTLAMLVGVQPHLAGPLFDGSDGGTPQRFVWLPTIDPTAAPRRGPDGVRRPRPAPPAPRTLRLPRGYHEMSFPEAAWAEVDDQRDRVDAEDPTVDPLDGHALYTRVKVAGAMALLDQRRDTTEEDWHLAGVLMAASAIIRTGVTAGLRQEARAANLAAGRAKGAQDVVVADVVADALAGKATSAVRAVLAKAEPGAWTPASGVRRAITGRVRPGLDEALAALLTTREIESEDVEYHGTTGLRYRLRRG